jgi:plastocyanin
MLRAYRSIPGLVVVAAVAFAVGAPALAQVCITPNCAIAATPAICVNRATPRTPTVVMGSGLQNIFVPDRPKIEPGSCILWRSATSAHSSSGESCDPDPLCGSPAPPACQWDSANVDSFDPNPTATCYYDPALFPAEAASPYYCRIHATPTAGTMRGTLQVTTEIRLLLNKDLGTNSVVLNWTGGGVTGDVSYKVVRQTAVVPNPRFPVGATTTTVNPDGGVLGTSLVDVGFLPNASSRYYLVRNKQTNEN